MAETPVSTGSRGGSRCTGLIGQPLTGDSTSPSSGGPLSPTVADPAKPHLADRHAQGSALEGDPHALPVHPVGALEDLHDGDVAIDLEDQAMTHLPVVERDEDVLVPADSGDAFHDHEGSSQLPGACVVEG